MKALSGRFPVGRLFRSLSNLHPDSSHNFAHLNNHNPSWSFLQMQCPSCGSHTCNDSDVCVSAKYAMICVCAQMPLLRASNALFVEYKKSNALPASTQFSRITRGRCMQWHSDLFLPSVTTFTDFGLILAIPVYEL